LQTHQPVMSISSVTTLEVHWPCSEHISLWGLYEMPSHPKYTDLLPHPPALEVHMKCHYAQSTPTLL